MIGRISKSQPRVTNILCSRSSSNSYTLHCHSHAWRHNGVAQFVASEESYPSESPLRLGALGSAPLRLAHRHTRHSLRRDSDASKKMSQLIVSFRAVGPHHDTVHYLPLTSQHAWFKFCIRPIPGIRNSVSGQYRVCNIGYRINRRVRASAAGTRILAHHTAVARIKLHPTVAAWVFCPSSF